MSPIKRSPSARALLVALAVCGAVGVACGGTETGAPAPAGPGGPVATTPTPPSSASTPPGPTSTGEPPPIVVDGTVNPTRPRFQAKSSAQLEASVRACVGDGAVEVTGAMLLGSPSPGGFLTADFAAGQNVLQVQAGLFDGNLESLRTSVRVDQITLEYITGLKNLGNVVGYRCSQGLVADTSLCTCNTFATAYAMLTRCLGTVADPATTPFSLLAAEFQTACEANSGSAIASLIASSAFAKLP